MRCWGILESIRALPTIGHPKPLGTCPVSYQEFILRYCILTVLCMIPMGTSHLLQRPLPPAHSTRHSSTKDCPSFCPANCHAGICTGHFADAGQGFRSDKRPLAWRHPPIDHGLEKPRDRRFSKTGLTSTAPRLDS